MRQEIYKYFNIRFMRCKVEAGLTLIEILVSIVVFSLMALAFTRNSMQADRVKDHANRHASVQQLAVDKIEELAAINPATLDDNDDATESSLDIDGVLYTRVTDITVNANGSRTIDVSVTANNSSRDTNFSLSHTVSLWGAL